MALSAGDSTLRARQAHDRTLADQWARVAIGATGAPTLSKGSAGFGISRSAAGTYALTFRAGRYGLHPIVVLKSAAKTVVTYVVTAFDPTAGTATIKTLGGANAAVDTDPANGDELSITIPTMPFGDG